MLLRRFPLRFIQTYAEQKQSEEAKKQKANFKEMVESLSKKESFTLRDFKKDVIAQDSRRGGFFRKMFTEAQPEEIQIEKAKKILNALKDDELNSSDKISGQAKIEIAQVSQTTIKDINSLLMQFKIQHRMHLYLKSRRERGEYIPQTSEELQSMMRTDKPVSNKEDRFDHEKKYSSKQMKWIGGMGRYKT